MGIYPCGARSIPRDYFCADGAERCSSLRLRWASRIAVGINVARTSSSSLLQSNLGRWETAVILEPQILEPQILEPEILEPEQVMETALGARPGTTLSYRSFMVCRSESGGDFGAENAPATPLCLGCSTTETDDEESCHFDPFDPLAVVGRP